MTNLTNPMGSSMDVKWLLITIFFGGDGWGEGRGGKGGRGSKKPLSFMFLLCFMFISSYIFFPMFYDMNDLMLTTGMSFFVRYTG